MESALRALAEEQLEPAQAVVLSLPEQAERAGVAAHGLRAELVAVEEEAVAVERPMLVALGVRRAADQAAREGRAEVRRAVGLAEPGEEQEPSRVARLQVGQEERRVVCLEGWPVRVEEGRGSELVKRELRLVRRTRRTRGTHSQHVRPLREPCERDAHR